MVGNKEQSVIKNDSQVFVFGLGNSPSGVQESSGRKLIKIYTQIQILGGVF